MKPGIIESKRYTLLPVGPAYNTFIGFGGIYFPTKADFLAQTYGITEADITEFKIDKDKHLSMQIEKNYGIAPNLGGNKNIKHYIDLGEKKTIVSALNNLLYELDYTPIATFINNFGQGQNKYLVKSYTPNATPGEWAGDNSVYNSSVNLQKVVVHPNSAINNAGLPDGDLAILGNYGTEIIYSNDLGPFREKPAAPIGLTMVSERGASASFSFSQPAKFLDVIGYEVSIDGVFNNISYPLLTGGVIRATGLPENSSMQLHVRAIDELLKRSDLVTLNFTTTTKPAANLPASLQSFYPMKEKTGDSLEDAFSANTITINNFMERGIASKVHNCLKNYLGNIKLTCSGVRGISFFIWIDPLMSYGSHYLIDYRTAHSGYMFNTSGAGISKFCVNTVAKSVSIANIPKGEWAHIYLETSVAVSGVVTLLSRYTNSEWLRSSIANICTYTAPLTTQELANSFNNGNGILL